MKVNFGNVAEYYSKFRNDLPTDLIESLKIRGIKFKNRKIIDLGAGTGVLTRAIAKEGAHVIGVEPSKELTEQALVIDQSENITNTYLNEYAEHLSLPDQNFDYVTVLRAWHWFDRKNTINEVRRVLKKNGKLIVMDSGFNSKHRVVKDTLEIIKKHMPNQILHPAGSKAQSKQIINSFPVEWFLEWKENNFDLRDFYKLDYTVSFTNEDWCGKVGSLSWLATFTKEKHNEILQEIYNHLSKTYENNKHTIPHSFYVAILKQE